jgi:hypothetical protein
VSGSATDDQVDDYDDPDDGQGDDSDDQDTGRGKRGTGRRGQADDSGADDDDSGDDQDTGRRKPRRKPKAEDKESWINELAEPQRRWIRDLQRTARGHSSAARKAQERLEEMENETLTDVQRADRRATSAEDRATKAEERLRQFQSKAAIERAASAAKAKKPERVWNMVKDDVEYDPDTGEVINAEELIAELRKSDPYLFTEGDRQGSADGGAGGRRRPRSGFDMTQEIRRQTGRA